VEFPRESPDVILEGFIQLLLASLQVSGVVGPHVCALEHAGEDLLEILLVDNRVSRQVLELGPSHVGQVNREERDDVEVVICLAHPTCKVIVFQLNTGIHPTIILDDVIRCSKMLQEACVKHVALKRHGSWPLRAEAAPFLVIVPTATQIMRTVLKACALIPPPPPLPQRAWQHTGGTGRLLK
jgi:hypothetical protein